ncbi:hypothetical protein AAVH_04679 [Aphelenchoides avenae]|nr:hypothetical protein AAVH_04679 [Aphelenchus avenae]
MRPIHYVLGLAFAATVLTVNVDAIKCYIEGPGHAVEAVDCDDKLNQLEDDQGAPRGTFPRARQCATGVIDVVENGERIRGCVRDCLYGGRCNRKGVRCTTRCDSDLCNGGPDPLNGGPDPAKCEGAVTSTTAAPLLIAIIAGVIAVVGF